MGTRWPALLTVFSSKNPAYLQQPEVLPLVFQTENSRSLRYKHKVPEFISICEVQPLHPSKSARGLDNQIILAVIDEDVDILGEQVLHQVSIGHHEVPIHGLIDFVGLGAKFDVPVQGEDGLDVGLAQELADQCIRVVAVLGDVVNVDVAGFLYNVVEDIVEGVMQLLPSPDFILEGSVHYHALYSRSLLVVDEAQIVSILADLSQDVVGVSEAITNRNTLQSSEEAIVLELLLFDFLGDGGGVLAGIALSEDEQILVGAEVESLEASIAGVIELVQGEPEILGHVVHGLAVHVGVGGVGVREPSAHGLVHEQYIVLFGPCEIILDNLVGCHNSRLDKMRPQLHEVAQLAGRPGSSIQPDNNRILSQIGPSRVLPAVENEPERRLPLPHAQVPAHHSTIITVPLGAKRNIITDRIDGDTILGRLLPDTILNIDALLGEVRGGPQGVGQNEKTDQSSEFVGVHNSYYIIQQYPGCNRQKQIRRRGHLGAENYNKFYNVDILLLLLARPRRILVIISSNLNYMPVRLPYKLPTLSRYSSYFMHCRAEFVARKVPDTSTRHIFTSPSIRTHWVASSFSVRSFSVTNCFSSCSYYSFLGGWFYLVDWDVACSFWEDFYFRRGGAFLMLGSGRLELDFLPGRLMRYSCRMWLLETEHRFESDKPVMVPWVLPVLLASSVGGLRGLGLQFLTNLQKKQQKISRYFLFLFSRTEDRQVWILFL